MSMLYHQILAAACTKFKLALLLTGDVPGGWLKLGVNIK